MPLVVGTPGQGEGPPAWFWTPALASPLPWHTLPQPEECRAFAERGIPGGHVPVTQVSSRAPIHRGARQRSEGGRSLPEGSWLLRSPWCLLRDSRTQDPTLFELRHL